MVSVLNVLIRRREMKIELILNDVSQWFKQRLNGENYNELLEMIDSRSLKKEKNHEIL
jgi:hypothetical protein